MGNRELQSKFLGYAVLCWPEHAAFARTEFSVIREHESFFQLESKEREKWLRMFNSIMVYPQIPRGFSIFHVAARWSILCLVDFGLTNMTKMDEPIASNSCASRQEFDNAAFKAQNGVTALETAVWAGHIDVIYF